MSRTPETKVIYHLTGAGSALVETDFPGSDHEMVSVYHLDGDDLRLTHYCAAGNQPRLKLDRANSTPTRFVFVFDGGSNLDPAKDMHIHGMTMTFEKEARSKAAWEAYAGGKPAGTTRFNLPREALTAAQPEPTTSIAMSPQDLRISIGIFIDCLILLALMGASPRSARTGPPCLRSRASRPSSSNRGSARSWSRTACPVTDQEAGGGAEARQPRGSCSRAATPVR